MTECCKWMDKDTEVCCNDQFPVCCDFCPTSNYPGVCKYDSRSEKEES